MLHNVNTAIKALRACRNNLGDITKIAELAVYAPGAIDQLATDPVDAGIAGAGAGAIGGYLLGENVLGPAMRDRAKRIHRSSYNAGSSAALAGAVLLAALAAIIAKKRAESRGATAVATGNNLQVNYGPQPQHWGDPHQNYMGSPQLQRDYPMDMQRTPLGMDPQRFYG
jgi:hypothetical protein